MTLSELAPIYLRRHSRRWCKPRSVQTDTYLFRAAVLPILGGLDLKDLTYKRVEAWHFTQRDHPVRANRALALLSSALNEAMRWGYLPAGANPCALVRRYKEEGRATFLDEEGWQALWRTLDDWADRRPAQVAVIRLLCLTGARLGEWLHSRWEWIDQDPRGWTLRLPDSKTGAKVIILPQKAEDVLRGVRTWGRGEGLIFPGVSVHRTWHRVRCDVRRPDLRLHDLRHSFVAAGLAAGATLEQMGELLGHRSVKTTKRYAHLAPKVAREVQARTVAGIIDNQKSED